MASLDSACRRRRIAARAVRLAGTSAIFAFGLCSSAAADWPVYGHDLTNSRNAGPQGPSAAQVRTMQAAWSFKSGNGDFTGTPVVVRGTLVAGTNLGTVYALDAATGRLRWSRYVGGQINGSAAIDPRAGRRGTVFVPVARLGEPRLVALSLRTGAVRWQRVLTRQRGAYVYGSPVYWHRTVYIGTSGPNSDEASARGSVVALSERTGELRWRTYTVPRGYDGGAVWSTPAIDTATGRLYVGTGNAYHSPVAATTDSIMELGAAHGRIHANFQSTPGDVCELNNPGAGPDYDFGASPNLIRDGRRPIVAEGQKSGIFWALDRRSLRPVWHTQAGPGSGLDGGINSTGYDGLRIYGSDAINGEVFALAHDGEPLWSGFDTGSPHFSPIAIGNHVVYSTDPAGFLTARDAATGAMLVKLPLGAPTFAGVSVAGQAVYVAIGTGPPPAADPSLDTSHDNGAGSIIAFGHPARSSTFAGSCDLSGTVHFHPSLGNAQQQGSVAAQLAGRCSGTLTNRRGQSKAVNGAGARLVATSAGLESCEAGRGTGNGYLAIGRNRLHLSYNELRTGPALALKADGAAGGSAVAEGNVSPSDSPASIAQACSTGGLTSAPVDVHLRTTPSISG